MKILIAAPQPAPAPERPRLTGTLTDSGKTAIVRFLAYKYPELKAKYGDALTVPNAPELPTGEVHAPTTQPAPVRATKPTSIGKNQPCPVVNVSRQSWHPSMIDAAFAVGCHVTGVSSVCNGRLTHIKGFVFRYATQAEIDARTVLP